MNIHFGLAGQLVEVLNTIIPDKMEHQINPNIQTALAWQRLICFLAVKIKNTLATSMQVIVHKFCKWHFTEKDDHIIWNNFLAIIANTVFLEISI